MNESNPIQRAPCFGEAAPPCRWLRKVLDSITQSHSGPALARVDVIDDDTMHGFRDGRVLHARTTRPLELSDQPNRGMTLCPLDHREADIVTIKPARAVVSVFFFGTSGAAKSGFGSPQR